MLILLIIFFPQLVALGLFLAISLSPFWCLVVGLLASYRLLTANDIEQPMEGWQPMGWLTAYGIAWAFAISQAALLYSRLPKEAPPPLCYIATAAAQGHPRIVGSRPETLPNNQTIHINQQLRVFKCFELGLMGVHPAGHRHLRKIYNYFGPRLARRLTNPYLADLAYLTLKPLEWLTRLFLRIATDDLFAILQQIYPYPNP